MNMLVTGGIACIGSNTFHCFILSSEATFNELFMWGIKYDEK